MASCEQWIFFSMFSCRKRILMKYLFVIIGMLLVSLFSTLPSIAGEELCYPKHQFQCDKGKCIPITHRCDGEADCGTGDYSDENYCEQERLADEFVVIVDAGSKNIYELVPKTGAIRRLLPVNSPNPVAVAINLDTKQIYYTDVSLAVIGRITVDDYGARAMDIIYTDNTGSAVFDGLAVDHVRNKLYYGSAAELGSIGELSTDGSKHRSIVIQRGIKPRALCLDIINRLLYWTDWGETPSINLLNVVSGQRIVLVSTGLYLPNALVVDFQNEFMLWADAGTHHIEYSELDGTNRKVLLTDRESHFFAMALTPSQIFVNEWNRHSVRVIDRLAGEITTQTPISFSKLMGIAAYNKNTNSTGLQQDVGNKWRLKVEL